MASSPPLPATLVPATLDAPRDESPPAAPSMAFELQSVEDPSKAIHFNGSSEVAFGRDASHCQMTFPECGVLSRVHCKVFSLGRDVFLNDISSNGTFLNGKLLGKGKQKVLRSGDTICLVNPHSPDSLKYTWKYVPPPSENDETGDGSSNLNNVCVVGKVLGTGNFATVRLGTMKATGEKVAIKIIEKKRFALSQSDFSFQKLYSEVEILRKMNHPNIIRVVDVFDDPKSFTMLLELVSNGDLFDYIVGRCPNPFTELECKQLFIQLVEALIYMHAKGVVHRDLKPENILVAVDPSFVIPNPHGENQANARYIPVNRVTLKITDFGLAKFCSEQSVMTTMCGTPSYLAPEVLVPQTFGAEKSQGYSWGVDVWSLGVILYIMLSGTPPKDPQKGILPFPKQFDKVTQDAKDLVQLMLRPDPRERGDLKDIVSHSWLRDCVVRGRETAMRKEVLKVEGTVIMRPTPTVPIVATPELPGNVTEQESDSEQPKKRSRVEGQPPKALPSVFWQWKKKMDLPDADDSAWQSYDVTDSDHIERMQSRGAKSCKVGTTGDYRISFEGMFQYNKNDTSKQRPVRRFVAKQ